MHSCTLLFVGIADLVSLNMLIGTEGLTLRVSRLFNTDFPLGQQKSQTQAEGFIIGHDTVSCANNASLRR